MIVDYLHEELSPATLRKQFVSVERENKDLKVNLHSMILNP